MASNKSKILQAASELLLAKGPSGLSVRAIAKLAGVSTIGIYSHFNGKQGVLDALYVEGFERVYDVMSSACEIDEPKTAVLQGVKNYRQVAVAHEATYRLIFGETNADYEPGPEAQAAGLKAFGSLVELASKLLPADASLTSRQRAALRIWALVHGFLSLQHHAVQGVVGFDDWGDQTLVAIECIVDNILAEGI